MWSIRSVKTPQSWSDNKHLAIITGSTLKGKLQRSRLISDLERVWLFPQRTGQHHWKQRCKIRQITRNWTEKITKTILNYNTIKCRTIQNECDTSEWTEMEIVPTNKTRFGKQSCNILFYGQSWLQCFNLQNIVFRPGSLFWLWRYMEVPEISFTF